MSINDLENHVISSIKSIMKRRKISITSLSKSIDIPYRSMQNYLSGQSKMPATVYLKVCENLGVDNEIVLNSSFEFKHYPFWDALWDVLGDGLADVKITPNKKSSSFDNIELHNKKQKMANTLTNLLNEAYAKNREHSLYENYTSSRQPTTSQIMSQISSNKQNKDE